MKTWCTVLRVSGFQKLLQQRIENSTKTSQNSPEELLKYCSTIRKRLGKIASITEGLIFYHDALTVTHWFVCGGVNVYSTCNEDQK